MKLPGLSRALLPLALAATTALRAADFMPAIVYDFGGKFDRSFNQSASEGAEKFKKDTGIAYREFEITKVHRTPDGIAAALATAGFVDVEVTITGRFFVLATGLRA